MLVGFAENLDHLIFGESGLAHTLLAWGGGRYPLNFQSVRKSASRSVLMAISMQYLNGIAQDATRKKLAAEQAREMYMLAKATEDWMVANSKGWTIGARMSTTVDALITANHLPQNFARRMDVAGATSNGVTPFGARYNIAAIAATLDGKRVHRGVIWETGTPVGWARYARVGLLQGDEPANGSGATSKINVFKMEVARVLNTDLKHPAPGIANVTAATVRGGAGSWTQDVSAYLGSGVTFQVPSVVILAGWPEYGSVLPQTPESGLAGECTVHEGNQFTTTPSCPAGEALVKSWVHCEDDAVLNTAETLILVVPEIGGSLTTGYNYLSTGPAISDADLDRCLGACADATCRTRCGTDKDSINGSGETEVAIYGRIVLNSTDAAYYLCGTRTWIPRATTSGGYMQRTNPSIPWATTAYDSLCCTN
jgi:hypothetical protein